MSPFIGKCRKTAPGAAPGAAILLGLMLLGGGCKDSPLAVPDAKQVAAAYEYDGPLTASIHGNVAEITIVQPARQLRRGGSLWAQVGPYVLLFSEETRGLFETFPGLAGVRVITKASGGEEVARALLRRDALTDLTWRRALHIAGVARRDGTKRPSLLQDLVRWGENHTEYHYNSRYSHP